MLNPWTILGALVAALGIAAGGFGFGHHVEAQVFDTYKSEQKAAAERQVANNKGALLAIQKDNEANMTKINLDHNQATDEIIKRRDSLLSTNVGLTQRLYVLTTSADRRAVVPSAAASGPVADGASYSALPVRYSDALFNLGASADIAAATVTSLQQVVAEDRRVCNGSLPGADTK